MTNDAPRLLVIAGYWPTSSNSISGIFVAQQVAAFVRAGYRITIVLPRTVGRNASSPLTPAQLGLDADKVRLFRAPVFRLPEKLSSLPGALTLNAFLQGKMLRRFFRSVLAGEQFDTCVIHGERVALGYPDWSCCVGGNTVVVIHGVDPYWLRGRNAKTGGAILEGISTSGVEFVLVGNPLCSHARLLGLPPEKIHVVANGTDLPQRDELIRVQPRPNSHRVVLSVSNLVPLKGIDDNLRALSLLRKAKPGLEWEYRIIGEGSFRPHLVDSTHDLGIADRVRFLGRLSYEQTMDEMLRADIFSLPSWAEAFGIVYLEAMSRMKPVIGCLGNGAADIITDGKDGFLVPPRDVDKLRETLVTLLEDPDLCRRLGVKARQTAENFSWDANVKRMCQLMDQKIDV